MKKKYKIFTFKKIEDKIEWDWNGETLFFLKQTYGLSPELIIKHYIEKNKDNRLASCFINEWTNFATDNKLKLNMIRTIMLS